MNRDRGATRFGVLLVVVVVATFLGITLLFWSQVWWGNRLSDQELAAQLEPAASVREHQHALAELSRRYEERQPGLERWIAPVVELSRAGEPIVQATCAWVMQYDASRPEFGERLRELVASEHPLVRRNAATSLASGGDDSGLPVLRAMLEPYPVVAPIDGRLERALAAGQPVREGDTIARLTTADGRVADVRSPLPGTVAAGGPGEGATVAAGAPLVTLIPDSSHAHAAVAALLLVGTSEDLPRLRALAGPDSTYPIPLKELANKALQRVEARSKASAPR